MPRPIHLCLALHNHQPVGNFEQVFEQSYGESYRPFLDVFESYADLRISLHTSGPLMEWLDRVHPEYLDRLAHLISAGRIEILGGPFYEPILPMIPSRDRRGQISLYTRWLETRLGCRVRGMWMPERVWEQSLTADLAAAGIEYTILDDFHFRNAGLPAESLHGYYVTEDEGELVSIFPGSEQLRYCIPFQEPDATIRYLEGISESHENAIVVFGDDGEKFGTWPNTFKHVYENGWLRRFFDALTYHREWLRTSTISQAYESVGPKGKIYLPEGSYREMTEWAQPLAKQRSYEQLKQSMREDSRWKEIEQFVRGGYWRNFKIKYPETDEMYGRMLAVSRRLQMLDDENSLLRKDSVVHQGHTPRELLAFARRELYRAQCNCSYWHGAFGGAYLPHLRNAVFNHLIAADNLMDQATGENRPSVSAVASDFNLDGQQEIRLQNDQLICLVAPHQGGMLYELDVRSICHNLLATLNRREEPYHHIVQKGDQNHQGECASIHDRVVFKQANLERRLQYDRYPRKAMLDHFLPQSTSLEEFASGTRLDGGDFLRKSFDARIRKGEQRIQVMMSAEGEVDGFQLKLTKGITLEAGSSSIEIAYMVENLPSDRIFHFGSEFNLAGLPAGADDRYFYLPNEHRLGELGSPIDLTDSLGLGLADEWLGIRVMLAASRPTQWWAVPVQTVSQSEGGFELVHQSVAVIPHWFIQGDAEGRWSVRLTLDVDTTLAESRQSKVQPAAVLVT
jgi:4-alpha-glucanotransferase